MITAAKDLKPGINVFATIPDRGEVEKRSFLHFIQ
jgi:hypothetical protein